MQRHHFSYGILIVAAAVVLSGCGNTRAGNILGFEKSAPDEFAVVKRAPLTLPPDFGLRPPRPGVARPQEVSARSDAKSATLRKRKADRAALAGSRSAGEVALLNRTGAINVDPSIRQVVNREAAGAEENVDESFVDKLLFWRETPKKKEKVGDVIVDATKESRRLRENEVLGKPVTAGRTPTIRRKESSGLLF